jgi:hypothetical protein
MKQDHHPGGDICEGLAQDAGVCPALVVEVPGREVRSCKGKWIERRPALAVKVPEEEVRSKELDKMPAGG